MRLASKHFVLSVTLTPLGTLSVLGSFCLLLFPNSSLQTIVVGSLALALSVGLLAWGLVSADHYNQERNGRGIDGWFVPLFCLFIVLLGLLAAGIVSLVSSFKTYPFREFAIAFSAIWVALSLLPAIPTSMKLVRYLKDWKRAGRACEKLN